MAFTLLVLWAFIGALQASSITWFDTSDYKILQDPKEGGFSYFNAQCRALGNGWAPVIVGPTFVSAHILEYGVRPSCRRYWVGGSTNVTGTRQISFYPEYIQNDSGVNRVAMFLGCQGTHNFSLEVIENPNVNSIICKKPRQSFGFGTLLKFASSQNYYQTLYNSSTQHNYLYWSSRCKDLGCGWGPTILDREEELDFIRKGQNLISWIQSYWLGGSTDAQKGSTLQYSDYNTDRSGREEVSFTGLEIASTLMKYRKIQVESSYAMTYGTAAYYCYKMGNRWGPAIPKTSEELNFIREGQKTFSSSARYWIGGTTNSSFTLSYTDYFPNDTGERYVMVDTHRTVRNNIWIADKQSFNLKAPSHGATLNGILCQQEFPASRPLDMFATATSDYKKIVGSANSYSHYSSKCQGLGDGWGTAVFDTEIEHDFIRQSQKGLSNTQDYFIGGSAYPEVTCGFTYVPAYSPSQSENPVYVSTENEQGEHSNDYFSLMSALPNATAFGILCEKEKI